MNLRTALDLIDQVPRHRGRQALAADDDVHVRAGAGEERGGLPGRVASTDDDDRPPGTRLGLHLGGGVVHADPLELAQTRQRKSVVARTGGDDHRLRAHRLPVLEIDSMRVDAGGERHGPFAQADAYAELLRLQRRSRGQLVTREAGRKAEIVFDPSRGTRLPPERRVLGERRAQAFRRAVHGCRESRGTGADHEQVALGGVVLECRRQAECAQQPPGAAIPEQVAAGNDDDRQVRGLHVKFAQQRLGLGRPLQLEPWDVRRFGREPSAASEFPGQSASRRGSGRRLGASNASAGAGTPAG